MAYVPRFDHDIFISYAQVAENDWVLGFREKLQGHLGCELHQDKAASIFWDRNESDEDSPIIVQLFGAKCDDDGYETWLCERAKVADKVPSKDLLLRNASLMYSSSCSPSMAQVEVEYKLLQGISI
jgi:hypothetical protein